MTTQGFQFESSQSHQVVAIDSVIGLFDGQPKNVQTMVTALQLQEPNSEDVEKGLDFDFANEVGAIGNNIVLDRAVILDNLQRVQDQNGLKVDKELHGDSLDFDIEMETGTGKTYVYLRTIFELAQKYNFNKFVILVPSVAIREGVISSIRLTRAHFNGLYPQIRMEANVYSGKTAEEVQSFATSTTLQILIMTIDSIRGDANTRVIRQTRDKLNGLRPIDYLQATRPIVIMDEPQNMESLLSQSAVGDLNPSFTLRYSATHKTKRNVIYRLDPVDAHELGLVKQIVVADVQQQGADAIPYVKLVGVKSSPSWTARLELAVRNSAGQSERREVNVRINQELSDSRVTNNPMYEGMWVAGINSAEDNSLASIELNSHGVIMEGESVGSSSDAVYKEMIRETIKEHLRKENQLKGSGIKVLTLFFIDKVARFLGSGQNNFDADGEFVAWFDELLVEERNKNALAGEILPQEPQELRRAYFSQIKRGKNTVSQDSTGTTKADDDAYELIMQDKERLLDPDEPTRFIFSHSALREGWDNPNVFQICSLREMGAEVERRQTIGRGLRLPVMKTPNGYVRIRDRALSTLTVVANESYQVFAKSLQNEYKTSGVEIGKVRINEFARILSREDSSSSSERQIGFAKSQEIFDHLTLNGFLEEGQATSKFMPNTVGFSLALPEGLRDYESEIIELVQRSSMERFVRPRSNRVSRTLSKAVYLTPEFEAFWDSISKRTTFRVEIDRKTLISSAISALSSVPTIPPLRIEITRAGLKVLRGGAKGEELGMRMAELKGAYELPDVISELQHATSLTRHTLVEILVGSGKLDEFIGNPNDFIATAKRLIQAELAKLVVEGIQYERIAGSIYELRELQKDGEEEKDRFLDQLYKVQNTDKTDFDYVVFDSEVEREFAEKLDSREDVKFFMKLPSKFRIPTPVGDYNPDWAIVKQVDGHDRLYMIRETKSTQDDLKLRPTEKAKIVAAKRHFEAIGIENYAVSAPGQWNL